MLCKIFISLFVVIDFIFKNNVGRWNLPTGNYNELLKLTNVKQEDLNFSISFDIDIKLKDKQVIRRYGIYLKIFDLPGHTNGSIGIKYKDYLFVGDALVKRGKYPTIAFQNQDLESAKVSARVINDIKPNIIFLGHDKPFSFDKFDIDKCY